MLPGLARAQAAARGEGRRGKIGAGNPGLHPAHPASAACTSVSVSHTCAATISQSA